MVLVGGARVEISRHGGEGEEHEKREAEERGVVPGPGARGGAVRRRRRRRGRAPRVSAAGLAAGLAAGFGRRSGPRRGLDRLEVGAFGRSGRRAVLRCCRHPRHLLRPPLRLVIPLGPGLLLARRGRKFREGRPGPEPMTISSETPARSVRFQWLRVLLRADGARDGREVRPLGGRILLGDRRASGRHRDAGARVQRGAAQPAHRHELHVLLRHGHHPLQPLQERARGPRRTRCARTGVC